VASGEGGKKMPNDLPPSQVEDRMNNLPAQSQDMGNMEHLTVNDCEPTHSQIEDSEYEGDCNV